MNDIKNIKGAIFDMDGTVLDSMELWQNVGIEFLLKNGITPPPDTVELFCTLSIKQAAQYYINNFDNTKTEQEIIDGINGMVEDFYFNIVELKPGVKEFLELLKKINVKMCVATATDTYLIEKALKRNNIYNYFTEIFTCTNVGHGKDEPIIYREALKHLGTKKNETFIFEDALYAMKTAKNDGFNVVCIKDIAEKAEVETLKQYSDYYIQDYFGLIEHFK
ncbi:MAG: HAD family hydrolase [Acutalibacteraceae bacterium]